MSELILKSGPTLLWRWQEYDSVTDEERYIDLDVTTVAHEYLFESATLDQDVLLADIFKLLDAAPVLTTILRRDFSSELLDEVRKGVAPGFEYAYSPEGIEFLELYQCWHLNTATREYEPVHRLDFHGIGYELREDLDHGNGCIYSAGIRINWGVSMTPVRELLALPIRFNPVVSICENDLSAKKYAHELEKVQLTGINLGQILHGILWELSWYGAPEKQAQMRARLQAQVT